MNSAVVAAEVNNPGMSTYFAGVDYIVLKVTTLSEKVSREDTGYITCSLA
ncbi:hypothetical protein [Pantoea agglomerans]|nr:hypothetical protein [Pantoea agglomerans]MBE5683306.1 hypothetical protein [Pantoea agglomerans]